MDKLWDWHITVFQDKQWIHSQQAIIIASASCILAVLISTIHMAKHLTNYSMPQIQVKVIKLFKL